MPGEQRGKLVNYQRDILLFSIRCLKEREATRWLVDMDKEGGQHQRYSRRRDRFLESGGNYGARSEYRRDLLVGLDVRVSGGWAL